MSIMDTIGKNAKSASRKLGSMETVKKNECLKNVADTLVSRVEEILAANEKDIENAKANQMSEALIDRLRLTKERVLAMQEGIMQIISLEDPIGEVLSMKQRPNGLLIGEKRVPLGVIGIIYESRPNVTVDAFSLCFKTGNAVILRGGSDAIHSNITLVKIIQDALEASGVNKYAVQLLEDTSRETAAEMMKCNEYIDVLIPRGGAGLIKTVVNTATVPVIETGTGNCHIFVDESADFENAIEIIKNAKLQRLGVCNAMESLVVHENIAKEFLPLLAEQMKQEQCEMRGDATSAAIDEYIKAATEEDFKTEYLAKIFSVKIVKNVEEAIEHINECSTGHSESILTKSYENSQKFLNEIDSAAVYVNASTRFTDGFEFGFGAEIGISTQKLHARGPMGLLALTSKKFIIYGEGQIRK